MIAAGRGSTPSSREALQTLCSGYWYPLYALARRSGRDADSAQDSVQAFFTKLIEKETLAAADPRRGRFRDFLLVAFRNHMRNETESERAFKRGGDRLQFSLDARGPEGRFLAEPEHRATPDRLFERDWALAVLERVLARLRESYASAGKGQLFDALKETLAGDERAVQATQAAALGMTAGAFKVAAHRLRCRYRETLRAEIAGTLAGDGNIEDEIRALFAALAPV